MPEYAGMSLHEELETRFADAERRRQEKEMLSRGWQPPARWLRVGQGLKHDLEDIGYGMKKALSGATLGASDWALRKLGVTDDDYLSEREAEGLGNAVKGAGFVSELGGNMLGAGGALVKNLGKAGLKGLKLAFMGTYNNPQVVKTGVNNGYPRLYKYSVYNNPEHNNRVYDLISQSEKGKVLTKVAREGKHGKESLEKM